MNNSTQTRVSSLIAALIIATFTTVSNAAVFVKYEGVPGEAKSETAQAAGSVQTSRKPTRAALLLPAVQKVREAAAKPAGPVRGHLLDTGRPTAGDEHEIEYDITASH